MESQQIALHVTNYFTAFITIASIIKINMYLDACNKPKSSRKWDFVEAFFALMFGWIGVLYIFFEYSTELFTNCTKEKMKQKKKKNKKSNQEIIQPESSAV